MALTLVLVHSSYNTHPCITFLYSAATAGRKPSTTAVGMQTTAMSSVSKPIGLNT